LAYTQVFPLCAIAGPASVITAVAIIAAAAKHVINFVFGFIGCSLGNKA
jgi:hypothetical protein